MKQALILAAILAAVAGFGVAVAQADTVHLHDGKVVHGKVLSPDNASIVEVDTPYGLVRYRRLMVRSIEKNDQGIPRSGDAPATQPDKAVSVDPQTREAYAAASRAADAAVTADEGLAVWNGFLGQYGDGSLGDMAREQLALWQSRREQKLVRFGPQWLPHDQAAARVATADALIGRAESTANVDQAIALLNEAIDAHPYRSDIPFRKAVRYYQVERMREFGQALGDVIKLENDHVAARNNAGVLAARQTDWSQALMHLGRAANAAPDNDVVLDNLDLVIHLAESADWNDPALPKARRQIDALVARLHEQGKHIGEVRWGNAWVKKEQYEKMQLENEKLDRELGANRTKLAGLNRDYLKARKEKEATEKKMAGMGNTPGSSVPDRGNGGDDLGEILLIRYMELKRKAEALDKEMEKIEADGRKIIDASAKLDAGRHRPTHATSLVLLGYDGKSRLGEFKVAPDPVEEAPDPKTKPKPKPKATPTPKPADGD